MFGMLCGFSVLGGLDEDRSYGRKKGCWSIKQIAMAGVLAHEIFLTSASGTKKIMSQKTIVFEAQEDFGDQPAQRYSPSESHRDEPHLEE